MSTSERLRRALARAGIAVSYDNGIYQLSDGAAQATVLLPAELPLEEKAVRQLLHFAAVRSPDGHHGVCRACATPDFHPGSIAPVGSIVATDPGFVIPAAVGTDINCGMRLLTTGLSLAQLEPLRAALVDRLTHVLLRNGRDVPVRTLAFKALFDGGPQAFIDELVPEGLWAHVDRQRLSAEVEACVGLGSFGGASRHAPDAYVGSRSVYRDPCLGTPGGGNHFVELQVVDEVLDRHAAYAARLRQGQVVVMIHSGSRDLGRLQVHAGGRVVAAAAGGQRDEQRQRSGEQRPPAGVVSLIGIPPEIVVGGMPECRETDPYCRVGPCAPLAMSSA